MEVPRPDYRPKYGVRQPPVCYISHMIPTMLEIKEALRRLPPVELEKLAEDSGAPLSTLRKIRTGETPNPGYATVRQFWVVLSARSKR